LTLHTNYVNQLDRLIFDGGSFPLLLS
jgi:hypothetical protein